MPPGDLCATGPRLCMEVELHGAVIVHRVQRGMHGRTNVVPAYAGRMPSERYPDVDQHPKFPDVERSIIETWRAERTFERSVEQRPLDDEYVFYDGPPFANGP